VCKSLLAFHCNYGSVLYHFRDKARKWPKIAMFSYPLNSTLPLRGRYRNIAIPFGVEKKLGCCDYPRVKKFDDIFSRFARILACN